MSFTFFWIKIFITLQALDLATPQDDACASGDFCTYQCHCNNSCQGRTDGLCPDGAKCDKGWFGLRCQYKDLLTVPGTTVTFEPQQTISDWLTDRDDSTCNNDLNLHAVTVSWDREYPFTWLRIVMKDSNMLSLLKILYNTTNGYQECTTEKWSKFGQGTMDVRCEVNLIMKTLKIIGTTASLCTLYISGGRNIAYSQNASQSSTFVSTGLRYEALLAVDGNSISEFSTGTCSHTAEADMTPRFDLAFNTAYIIKQFVVYNRNLVQERLQGFRLQTLDVNNNIVDNIKENSTSPQLIYFITNSGSKAIKSVSVNETKMAAYDHNPFLTLCELEAFGECPQGKWGLPCTKDCSTSCPTSCHRDDGSRNTVCAGYSNPPDCTEVCLPTKWGINCANDCSTRCVNTSCDGKTGLCDKGCLGYSNPPYCTLNCFPGTWSINCSQSCSRNCVITNCEVSTGACDQGCKIGYQLPDCTKECQSGYWGVNCSTKCSDTCYNGECNRIIGTCILGCKDGFLFPDCSTGCQAGTYGRNCSIQCSRNCKDGLCNANNGFCTCQTGFAGNTCDLQSSDSKTFEDGFGAGIGAGIGIMVLLIILALVIAVLCVKLRHRSAGPVALPVNVPTYDKSNVNDDDAHTYDQVTNEGPETSAAFKPNTPEDRYIAMQHSATSSNNKNTTSSYENMQLT